MIAIRALSAVAVIAAALLASWQMAWLPLRANLALPRLMDTTAYASEHRDPAVTARLSRETLEEVLRLREFWPGDIRLDMLAGANAMALGRKEQAIGYYQHALTLDSRPEIFAALAQAELSRGNRALAIEHYAAAVEFSPGYLGLLATDPQTQAEVQELVDVRSRQARP